MDKPKFNLLDGAIILILILAIVVGVYLLAGNNNANSNVSQNAVAEFKVQFTEAEYDIYTKFNDKIASNETVWVGVKERFEGKISNVEVEPSKEITADLRTGKATIAQDPTLYDVTLTIKAEVVETDSAISASGTPIRVGEEVAVRGKGVAGFGFVIDLKTIAE